jgi:hypothetical protein
MSIIKITDLFPIGFKLFFDSESYINELDDASLLVLKGGLMASMEEVSTYVCSNCISRPLVMDITAPVNDLQPS